MLSAERIREVLDYNPRTGELFWGRDRPGRYRRGEPAGRLDRYGYLNVTIDGKPYKAHRVVWLLERGEWPADQIDHINGQRSDNRVENLREAGYLENGQNRAVQRNSQSGYQGVSWHSQSGKWRAQIAVAGMRHDLGRFDIPEQARDAYLAAKEEAPSLPAHPAQYGVKDGAGLKSRLSS